MEKMSAVTYRILYKHGEETIQHLFLNFPVVSWIWEKLLFKSSINGPKELSFLEEIGEVENLLPASNAVNLISS